MQRVAKRAFASDGMVVKLVHSGFTTLEYHAASVIHKSLIYYFLLKAIRGCQFRAYVVLAPVLSAVKEEQYVRLHLQDERFCLVSDMPPKILAYFATCDLRRYGPLQNKFCFEVGSRALDNSGSYILRSSRCDQIYAYLQLAAHRQLNNTFSCKSGSDNAAGESNIFSKLSSLHKPNSSVVRKCESSASLFHERLMPTFSLCSEKDIGARNGTLPPNDQVALNVVVCCEASRKALITRRGSDFQRRFSHCSSCQSASSSGCGGGGEFKTTLEAIHSQRSKLKPESLLIIGPESWKSSRPRGHHGPLCQMCHNYINQQFVDSLKYYCNVDDVVITVSRRRNRCKACHGSSVGESNAGHSSCGCSRCSSSSGKETDAREVVPPDPHQSSFVAKAEDPLSRRWSSSGFGSIAEDVSETIHEPRKAIIDSTNQRWWHLHPLSDGNMSRWQSSSSMARTLSETEGGNLAKETDHPGSGNGGGERLPLYRTRSNPSLNEKDAGHNSGLIKCQNLSKSASNLDLSKRIPDPASLRRIGIKPLVCSCGEGQRTSERRDRSSDNAEYANDELNERFALRSWDRKSTSLLEPYDTSCSEEEDSVFLESPVSVVKAGEKGVSRKCSKYAAFRRSRLSTRTKERLQNDFKKKITGPYASYDGENSTEAPMVSANDMRLPRALLPGSSSVYLSPRGAAVIGSSCYSTSNDIKTGCSSGYPFTNADCKSSKQGTFSPKNDCHSHLPLPLSAPYDFRKDQRIFNFPSLSYCEIAAAKNFFQKPKTPNKSSYANIPVDGQQPVASRCVQYDHIDELATQAIHKVRPV
ncbi:unnamed protein product [Soboliphyme baturini]|uniref:IRS-type PTB domain-containing protein n=1 Tax=Soboliphyme baturini TaxID=241478 RepID=A0A183IZE5_9BILA|nr:unnamed protein product [Soboliphyme baturini]